jgi:hypothetical protein
VGCESSSQIPCGRATNERRSRAGGQRYARRSRYARDRDAQRSVTRHGSRYAELSQNRVCGMVILGADGPARRSRSLSLQRRLGPPPIHSPRTAAGHDRLARSPRRIPAHRDACVFWSRAWDQREPAVQGTGRLHRPAQWQRLHKGGLDIPTAHAASSSLHEQRPIQTLTRLACSRAGRIGIFISHAVAGSLNDECLPVMHQPVDQGRCQGVVHVKEGAPFPEGSIRGEHD